MSAKLLWLAATSCLCAAVARADSISPALYGDLHWRQLGPFRGGWATMAEGVASQPNSFYFAAAGGGMWHSTDAGRTWHPLFQHGPAASIGAFAVAPSDPNIIYIGTGQPEPRYDIASGLGVFKSTDGGKTWQKLGLENTRYIGKIWVNPNDPNDVLVGAQGHFFGKSSDRGIYRSTDGGKSWTQTLKINDETGVVDIAADPQDPDTIFAAAWQAQQYPWQSYFTPVAGPGSAIYKSTDGGATWTRLSGGGWPDKPLGRISLAVASTEQGVRVYATVDGGKDKKIAGVYRSDDGGTTWQHVNDLDAFSSFYFSRITVDPANADIIYSSGQSIRRCTDGGAHCTIFKGAPGGDDYHYVWINPLHPDHMITASDQGAVVTLNGGQTWSSWYNQPTAQLYHLAADNRFPYWIYAGQQDSGTVGIASRSDYGAISFRDWHPVGGDERDYDIPDPTDPDIVYGSGLGGRVTKWDAHTGQVQNISPWPVSSYGKRPTEVKYHYLWVTPLVSSRTGQPALYLGAQNLFRSADRGATWQIISPDLTGKQPDAKDCGGNPSLQNAKDCGYGTISVIEPSPTDAATIWVGTDDGLIQATSDAGKSWHNITPAGTPLWGKIASLDMSAVEPNTAYAVIDGQRLDDYAPHILRTQDGGHSWQPIVSGLPNDHFVAVVRSDPERAGLLYAGTDSGVYVSFDDGENWSPLQQNLPTAWVRDLLVHGNDLIAATQGRGIWVLDNITPLRQVTADLGTEEAHLFASEAAYRVHPDTNADTPLPPETPLGENPPAGAVIDYWLGGDTSGPISLDIQDDAGNIVRHFASGEKPVPPNAERYFAKGWLRPAPELSAAPGMHRFVWDLHAERPHAISYTYSIAAVWGRDTPALPLGAWVVPGDYKIVLHADGETFYTPLTVKEDPRIHASLRDLSASQALSTRIDEALARNRIAYAEQQAVLKQLDAIAPADVALVPASTAGTPKADVPDEVRAIGDNLRKPPAKGELSFDAIDEILGGIETDLESADAAPTAAQRAVVDNTLTKLAAAATRWTNFKATQLPKLNADLAQAGLKPVTIPAADKLQVDAPDPGQDLP
ncbi:MAG TPA: hypothetical protein VMB71_08405 [Acetobacteraceae bacterium]|nr:hypothetical protein [Acetobacteraceae bacterium]